MRRYLLLATGLLAFAPASALAYIPVDPCPIPLPIPCGAGGVDGGVAYFWATIFPAARIVFVGVALIAFFYYGIQLLLARHEEQTIAEAKGAYEMAIFGCATVALASVIVEAFTPGFSATVTNPAPLVAGIGQVILYFKILLATVVIMRITIQGVRLIVLEGQAQGEMDKQKKQFLNGLLGVAVVLLANALVSAVFPGAGSATLAVEIRGIANFLLTITGAAAVLACLGAGVMLLVSVDESLKDKAKKTISGSVIALAVIFASFVIVNFFLGL